MLNTFNDAEAKVFKNFDGDEKIHGSISLGAILGAIALIYFKPRVASARITIGCTIFSVNQAIFGAKIRKAYLFIRRLLKILAVSIRNN